MSWPSTCVTALPDTRVQQTRSSLRNLREPLIPHPSGRANKHSRLSGEVFERYEGEELQCR